MKKSLSSTKPDYLPPYIHSECHEETYSSEGRGTTTYSDIETSAVGKYRRQPWYTIIGLSGMDNNNK